MVFFLDMEEGSEYLKLSFQRKELKDLDLGSIPTTQHTVLFWYTSSPSLFLYLQKGLAIHLRLSMRKRSDMVSLCLWWLKRQQNGGYNPLFS